MLYSSDIYVFNQYNTEKNLKIRMVNPHRFWAKLNQNIVNNYPSTESYNLINVGSYYYKK